MLDVLAVLVLEFVDGRVTPQNLECDFMLVRFGVLNDFERARNLFDFFDRAQRCSDATMQAQNRIFNHRCERHVLEHFIQPLEDRVRVIDIFVELLRALVSETHRFV